MMIYDTWRNIQVVHHNIPSIVDLKKPQAPLIPSDSKLEISRSRKNKLYINTFLKA